MKTAGILLIVIGAILLIASFAFPEGAREEQGFMQSAQQRANVMDHGDTQPADTHQAEQQADRTVSDQEGLFARAEHALLAGILLATIGIVLLGIDIMRKS